MSVTLVSLKLFACITEKEKLVSLLSYLLELKNDLLANTDWLDTTEKYAAVLLPNFFILYFGQKPPTWDIMSDDVKMAFSTLGASYKTWCTLAGKSINSLRKIATILSNGKRTKLRSHRFCPEIL